MAAEVTVSESSSILINIYIVTGTTVMMLNRQAEMSALVTLARRAQSYKQIFFALFMRFHIVFP